jgi:hypothetical protein
MATDHRHLRPTRAWLSASSVCGMTPSSPATTRTTMSTAVAPRARMAVKAAWPGVSTMVRVCPLRVDLVGPDVLGDAAGLARRDARMADGVDQGRLAVVDVAQEGDARRAQLAVLVLDVLARLAQLGDQGFLGRDLLLDLELDAELLGEDHAVSPSTVELMLIWPKPRSFQASVRTAFWPRASVWASFLIVIGSSIGTTWPEKGEPPTPGAADAAGPRLGAPRSATGLLRRRKRPASFSRSCWAVSPLRAPASPARRACGALAEGRHDLRSDVVGRAQAPRLGLARGACLELRGVDEAHDLAEAAARGGAHDVAALHDLLDDLARRLELGGGRSGRSPAPRARPR